MNLKRIYISVAALLCATFGAQAQDGGFAKRIEVTKDYQSQVESAEKLPIVPRMVDTVALRPEIDYSITPTEWQSFFKGEQMTPVEISTADWIPEKPLFVRLGLGLPLKSLADIYYTPYRNRANTVTLFLNHNGIEASVDNAIGYRQRALSLDNDGGARASFSIGSRVVLDAKVNYGGKVFTPYGGISFAESPAIKYGNNLLYNDVGGELVVGTSHDTDDAKTNFRAGGSGRYFWTRQDGRDYAQTDFNVFGAVSKQLGKGYELTFKAMFENRSGEKALVGKKDMRITLSPRLSFRYKKNANFGFDLGLDYVYNENQSGQTNRFLPEADVWFDALTQLTPYVSVTSSMGDGSYKGLLNKNPYVVAGAWVNNPISIDSRVGLRGDFGVLNYNIYVGKDIVSRYNFFVSLDGSSRFLPRAESVNVTSFGAVLNIKFARGLFFNFSGKILKPEYKNASTPNMENLYHGMGFPEFECETELKYENNRFSVALSADLRGDTDYATLSYSLVPDYEVYPPVLTGSGYVVNTVSGWVNLGIEGSYRFNDTITGFVSGGNLLGNRIFVYNYYPTLGANFMAVVKLNF